MAVELVCPNCGQKTLNPGYSYPCQRCGKRTMPADVALQTVQPVNHALHIALSLLTVGLWLPIYLLDLIVTSLKRSQIHNAQLQREMSRRVD